MANFNDYRKVTTATGTVMFSHIKSTEEILGKDTGKYTLCVSFDEEEMERILGIGREEFQKALEGEFKGKKIKKGVDPVLGEKEYEGTQFIRFSSGASYKTKTGRIYEVTIPIFDSMNFKITNKIGEFGYGSKVRVSFTVIPFYMTSTNFGVTLRLNGVQVIDYVPLGEKTAESFGFETVDGGYNGKEHEDEDLPWTPEDASGEDTGGDF